MIQRIQSVFLLLTTILAVLFLTGGIISFENGYRLVYGGIETGAQAAGPLQNGVLPLTVISLVVPLLALIIIFLYTNRRLQMRVTALLILLIIIQIAAVVWYSLNIINTYETQPVPGVGMILPLLMLVFSVLAYRGIRKDENIVRSYDRLR